jgi:hypothetical protein
MERFSALFLLIVSGSIAAIFINLRHSKEDEKNSRKSAKYLHSKKKKNLISQHTEESKNQESFDTQFQKTLDSNLEEIEFNQNPSLTQRDLSEKKN